MNFTITKTIRPFCKFTRTVVLIFSGLMAWILWCAFAADGQEPDIAPPGTNVAVIDPLSLSTMPLLNFTESSFVLNVDDNPGAVDIYESDDLANWSYLNTVNETNSSAIIYSIQGYDFYRGKVSGVSFIVHWNASLDTNVAGYFVYAGTQSRQYTSSYNAGLATNAYVFMQISNSGPVIYVTATSYNAAGWESDYANEASFSPMIPVLQLTP